MTKPNTSRCRFGLFEKLVAAGSGDVVPNGSVAAAGAGAAAASAIVDMMLGRVRSARSRVFGACAATATGIAGIEVRTTAATMTTPAMSRRPMCRFRNPIIPPLRNQPPQIPLAMSQPGQYGVPVNAGAPPNGCRPPQPSSV